MARVTDFAPRFRQFGRVFRPPQLYRIIEPIAGLPRITLRVRPTHGYGQPFARHSIGSNHIRYVNESTVVRLTTDAPLSLIERESPFVLTRPLHCVFGPDEPVTADLPGRVARRAVEVVAPVVDGAITLLVERMQVQPAKEGS